MSGLGKRLYDGFMCILVSLALLCLVCKKGGFLLLLVPVFLYTGFIGLLVLFGIVYIDGDLY